jgi:hypothetical protein
MRRPSIRSLAGGAAGIAAGVIGGVLLASVSAAGPPARGASPHVIDAAHVPPLLRLPGEPVRLRYAIVCAPRDDGRPCEGSGTVYLRAEESGPFHELPLRRGDDSKDGRYYADVPAAVAGSPAGFSYYAVLRDDATGATTTLPSGGSAAPQVSVVLGDPVAVGLGRHVFGRVREPDAHAARAAWGPAPQDAGLAGTRELGLSGPSSFDVEPDGTVDLLDSVNARVLRWRRGRVDSIPLAGGPLELSDFAVGSDGGFDVLEPFGTLRSFRADGTPRWSERLSDRTWAKLAHGPAGSVALQQPSEQWMPAADHGGPVERLAQARAARNGVPLANGHELVADRIGEGELRVAETDGHAPVRGWRILSETPLGEVQLVEPHGDRVVVVTKTYNDDRDEFIVLVLGRTRLVESFSVASDSWTETAPLARFRLAAGSLYRLRTTPTGVVVDRFGLEVPR